jgi:hypothetical protein
MTILIIIGIYLAIGVALIIWGVMVEPMILAALYVFPLFILFWPYFLIRMWFNR